ITIEADLPDEGMIFDEWTGDTGYLADVSSPATTVNMPEGSVTVSAAYKEKPEEKFVLNVNNGSGSGEYEVGYQVGVAADPAPEGQIFKNWTGDVGTVDNVNNPNTQFRMPENDASITAVFEDEPEEEFTLSVGSGSGSGEYKAGTMVTVTANVPEDDQQVFERWNGDTQYLNNPDAPSTSVIMPENNVSITARFRENDQELYILTVQSDTGTGSGEYEPGYTASIAASPAADGLVFDQWVGNVSRVSNIYNPNTVVSMPEADVTVRATYKDDPGLEDPRQLTVNQGTGSGEYRPGRVAGIAADVRDGFIFDRWVGQTSHVANVNIPNTTVVMPDTEVTVTATFKPDSGALFNLVRRTRVLEQTDQIIQKSLRRSTASSTDQSSIPAGKLVNLTAPAAPTGYTFDKWVGQTSHVDNIHLPRTLIYMPDNDVEVVATYRQLPEEVTLEVGSGTGDGTYAPGARASIQAYAPAEGMMFDKWEGQTSGVDNINREETFIVMPGTNVSINAVYRDKPVEVNLLTVNSGTGSGDYEPALEVSIRSGDAPEGQMFARWSGQIATVKDVNAQETTLYMPPHEVTVVASFDAYHTITATAGEGGSISPSGSVDIIDNEQAEFIVTADEGYSIDDVTGCGGSLSGDTYNTAPVTSACTVEAVFRAGAETHTVTASAGTGGSISPDQRVVSHGDTTTFTVTPNSNYRIDRVTGCGGTLSGSTYTTGPVTSDCQVSALFSYVPSPGPSPSPAYNVTVSADNTMGGTVSGAGRYTSGRTVTLTATPNPGFMFKGWMENGNIISTSSPYRFTINRSRNLTAVFEPLPSPGNERGFDLNQDHKADLVLEGLASREVLFGFMDGLDLAGGGLLTTLPEGWEIKAMGYFGGSSGLVLRHDKEEQIYLVMVDGLEITGLELIGDIPHEFRLMHAADMNGSGSWDLVFKHQETRDVYTVYLEGSAPVDVQHLGRLEDDMDIVIPADLTGDDKSELILRDMSSGELFMAETGAEGWEQTSMFTLPLEYELTSRGLINQDRKADLLFRNAENDELWVVYMDGAVPTGVDFAGHIPVADWQLFTVADYNADGLSDTLWMHVPTRTLVIALTGESLFSEVKELFELPREWVVKE
ncbi:MAG: InlB B-repeat-containing protein, partial [Desulfonatronovibrio sp.]